MNSIMANSGELPATSAEESSWGSHIRDFLVMQEMEGTPSFSNDGGSSIVSDAASMVFKTRGPKMLRFRRRSKRSGLWLLNDDDAAAAAAADALEDTATSPIDSPKVNSLNHIEKEEESSQNSQGAAVFDEMGRTEAAHIKLSDCNQLREKGLCLVPLSMLIDYIK